MTEPTLSLQEKWLLMLAKLVSPAFPEQASAALSAFLPFLEDIPEGAFTKRSLEAVAAAKRRQAVPSLDELRVPLLEWFRDNQQHVNRLAGPSPSLTQMDYAWVRYWHTRKREGFCGFGESVGGERHVAGLIRSVAPAAWAAIKAEDGA